MDTSGGTGAHYAAAYGRKVLAAWLPGCLAAWLPGCLAAWLLGFLAFWLPGFLAASPPGLLAVGQLARPSSVLSLLDPHDKCLKPWLVQASSLEQHARNYWCCGEQVRQP